MPEHIPRPSVNDIDFEKCLKASYLLLSVSFTAAFLEAVTNSLVSTMDIRFPHMASIFLGWSVGSLSMIAVASFFTAFLYLLSSRDKGNVVENKVNIWGKVSQGFILFGLLLTIDASALGVYSIFSNEGYNIKGYSSSHLLTLAAISCLIIGHVISIIDKRIKPNKGLKQGNPSPAPIYKNIFNSLPFLFFCQAIGIVGISMQTKFSSSVRLTDWRGGLYFVAVLIGVASAVKLCLLNTDDNQDSYDSEKMSVSSAQVPSGPLN